MVHDARAGLDPRRRAELEGRDDPLADAIADRREGRGPPWDPTHDRRRARDDAESERWTPTLRALKTAPDVIVDGYDADDRAPLDDDDDFVVIGRSADSRVRIRANIGGRRTFALRRDRGRWSFRIANEWAVVRINGVERCFEDLEHPVARGDRMEVLEVGSGRVVHAFAVE